MSAKFTPKKVVLAYSGGLDTVPTVGREVLVFVLIMVLILVCVIIKIIIAICV